MNDFMYRERHKTPRPLPANQLPLSEGTGYNSIFSSTSIHLAAPYLPSTKTNKKARVNFLFLLLSFCCFARADGLFCSNISGGQMVLLRAIDLKHRELIFWVIELKKGRGNRNHHLLIPFSTKGLPQGGRIVFSTRRGGKSNISQKTLSLSQVTQ